MSAHGSTKVILAALAANFGIAVAKTIGAAFTGSASLLAEAIHSAVDCTNQVLLLVGNRAARKPATERHPLGYGREAFFWSFMVAILLFSLGGLFAIYEGAHKLAAAEPVRYPLVVLAILSVSIALEGGSLAAALREVRAQNPYPNLWQWFRRTTAADLLVVLTEDLAALAGLLVATLCLLLALATGDERWDAIGSILVGSVLVTVAGLLAWEIKSLIVGEAPARELRPRIERIVAEEIPGGRVLRFIALQTGSAEALVSYKVHPGELATAKELVDAINRLEQRVRGEFPEVRWQFVEPDFEA
jgi:cation diffusion facilitator family transporter